MAAVFYFYRNYSADDTTHAEINISFAPYPSEYVWTGPEVTSVFVEWNTQRDGSGDSVQPREPLQGSTGTYYAIWRNNMPNSVISQITLPSGTTYDLKDAYARAEIEDLKDLATGAMYYIGISTTPITDGGTQNPTIEGTVKTMDPDDAGAVVIYGEKEYVWNGAKWQEFGSTGSLKALAFKDSATGTFTPAGTVSQPTFTGSSSNVTMSISANNSGNYQPAGTVSQPTFSNGSVTAAGAFTPEGSVTVTTATTENKTATVSKADSGAATYTPEGSVAAPTISMKTAGSTTSVTPIATVGSLPELTTSVSGEVLTIGFSQGTLPTKGTAVTVKTGDAAYEASAPAFTGTGARLVTGNIAVPKTYTGAFSGTESTVNVSGSATGTVSQPTFTGTKVNITGTTTAAGTVSQPTFTGTAGTVTVS